ncbi:MAG: hypothetical protein IMY71_12280 [Bacteroidetes bacterium]|nr:hypothetical protein [Bacteroidota bacterium]
MAECKKEQNMNFCNCTYPCGKKGTCCDCIHYHKRMGELPACYFPDDIEKGYDRTIENFVALFNDRGAWWSG